MSCPYQITEMERNIRNHPVYTIGNGNPMHEVCIRYMIPNKSEIAGRNRHQKNEGK